MRLLWTYSSLPISPLIKWATRSQSSHFSIEFFGALIVHSNFKGLGIVKSKDFFKQNYIVFEKAVPLPTQAQTDLFCEILINYWGSRYDWKWFFNLALKAVLCRIFDRPLPSSIAYQSRSKYICSETVKFLEKVTGPVNIGNGLPDRLWEEIKDRNIQVVA